MSWSTFLQSLEAAPGSATSSERARAISASIGRLQNSARLLLALERGMNELHVSKGGRKLPAVG